VNKKYYVFATLLLLIIAVRFYSALHNPAHMALKNDVGKIVTYEGKIVTESQTKDFSKSFVIETNSGFLIKTGTDKFGEYEYDDKVQVTGKLSSPRNFGSNGGRNFDYIDYLGKDGIYYEFKKAKIEIIEHADPKSIPVELYRLKAGFISNLKKVLGEPHAALASGLVVGEKAALGNDLIDDFRKAGLIHIVVLSGYNITIIAASIRRLLSFLPRNVSIILGALGIVLFGILVGGGATVVRSCVMALIALFAELIRRDYSVGRALFIAAACMLIQNPLILLYDPSFQLSFLATLGLILLSSQIEKKLGFITEKGGIRSLVASTFATQIFVSPLIFYMMGQLSIIGIIVNILVLPVIPLTMLLIAVAGLTGFFSHVISQIAGWGSHILLSYELFTVKFFAHLPFASIEVPAFSGWIVAGLYVFYLATLLKLPSMISQLIFAKKSSM
jgi:competence protein ComEC